MTDGHKERTRNFSIIAHIDHGKSTLADRLIEKTGLISHREMKNQILDNMDLERERGITIKLQSIQLVYKHTDGKEYYLNLIDTPGHVDFNYEVSRSLAACEGAILVVDASQGVEAQTLANVYLAVDQDLDILPVINKIDLPSARIEEVIEEIEEIIGIDASQAPRISAKNGINIEEVLHAIVEQIPSPKGDDDAPLQALIFDSYYDSYKGAVANIRVVEGTVAPKDIIRMVSTGETFEVADVGVFSPNMISKEALVAGDVGFLTASIKNVENCRVGDTITLDKDPCESALPGYKKVTPMVYCGIYPAEGEKYENIGDALEKLQLNDASLVYEPEVSVALGFGYRCGFLGLLHLEIIQQRLEREFDLNMIATLPSVIYRIIKTDGSILKIQNPTNMPKESEIDYMEEPIVEASIMLPNQYVGNIMELCQDRRGTLLNMEYIDEHRVILHYELPLNEVIYDFFDVLKSKTRGYGSLDYSITEYRKSKLVRLDILINRDVVDAFSMIAHESKAEQRGRSICEKLKNVIPRHMFVIPIQAAIGNKVIARETIKAMRKDVLAKCYGGDISRKKKLLEKQKEGKKKMRMLGNVEVPQDAFMAVLKLDDNK